MEWTYDIRRPRRIAAPIVTERRSRDAPWQGSLSALNSSSQSSAAARRLLLAMKRIDHCDKRCQLLFGPVEELGINFNRESRSSYSHQSFRFAVALHCFTSF